MALIEQLTHLETVRVEEADDDILLVTLDRPERLNAITSQLMEDMNEVVRAVDLDPATRAVVLTGAGRGFCAGLDLVGDPSVPPGAEGVGTIVGRFIGQDQIATLNENIHR
ncbi:MAG: enoyl-CoA hydratase-related protein, partial [Actinomycetota bacterium]|nr:enoyl-CoA hydratase-related protein [Actinomycetota bacterium]